MTGTIHGTKNKYDKNFSSTKHFTNLIINGHILFDGISISYHLLGQKDKSNKIMGYFHNSLRALKLNFQLPSNINF